MQGVLIVAHGSRQKRTEETFQKIVAMAKEKVDVEVETAYMEFSPKNIEAGLTALLEKGIHHIKVVPYFLFHGIHIQEDIPQELQAFRQKHPEVTLALGDTLGEDPRIADVLAERIVG